MVLIYKTKPFIPFKTTYSKFVLLNMLKIVLLGTGNVATHFFHALNKADNVSVIQVFGRNLEELALFKNKTQTVTAPMDIKEADVFLIAVSDSAVSTVSQYLKNKKGLVVHTSGSVPLNAISNKRKGVFYPLQTFTKEKKIDFHSIPICIETENANDYLILKELGYSVSNSIHRISSEQRQKLHLSAVLVNNFPNHLYHLAQEICNENELSFELLQPLISETVDKIRFLTPMNAQTGPAKRNDVETLQFHIEQIKQPLQKKIYQLLSESIKKTYEKEL